MNAIKSLLILLIFNFILLFQNSYSQDIYFTKEHEWIKVKGDTGIVGITNYAQYQLGDIIYLDITVSLDLDVYRWDKIGFMEAVATVIDIYCPISGRLIDVNWGINDNPTIVNEDPYGEGWIIKIKISDESELNDLLNEDEYNELTKEYKTLWF